MPDGTLSAPLCGALLRRETGKGRYFGVSRVDLLCERNGLFLRADHAHDLQGVCKLQPGDPFEALLQVRLHAERVLRLRQDLQQLVVRQEEEPVSEPGKTARGLSSGDCVRQQGGTPRRGDDAPGVFSKARPLHHFPGGQEGQGWLWLWEQRKGRSGYLCVPRGRGKSGATFRRRMDRAPALDLGCAIETPARLSFKNPGPGSYCPEVRI